MPEMELVEEMRGSSLKHRSRITLASDGSTDRSCVRGRVGRQQQEAEAAAAVLGSSPSLLYHNFRRRQPHLPGEE